MSGISVSREGAVGIITIDRPKANALDVEASREMYVALADFESDASIRVGVITGTGERFFSAGWDLKAAASGESADADFGPGGFGGITEYFGRRKPVIAAVNGIAFGGGFELVLASDLVVAAEHAEFALPEAALGIIADSGGVLRLPRIIGATRAAELLMTGRRLDAVTAHAWGLVNAVVPANALRATALELANSIAANAPRAIAAIMEITQHTDGMSLASAFGRLRSGELEIHASLASSADAAEGIAAFNEKRAPRWSGR